MELTGALSNSEAVRASRSIMGAPSTLPPVAGRPGLTPAGRLRSSGGWREVQVVLAAASGPLTPIEVRGAWRYGWGRWRRRRSMTVCADTQLRAESCGASRVGGTRLRRGTKTGRTENRISAAYQSSPWAFRIRAVTLPSRTMNLRRCWRARACSKARRTGLRRSRSIVIALDRNKQSCRADHTPSGRRISCR